MGFPVLRLVACPDPTAAIAKKTTACDASELTLAGPVPQAEAALADPPRPGGGPDPDLIGRDFTAERIDQRWCEDLTEIPTGEGKLYLATVLDLASRRAPASPSGSVTTRRWPRPPWAAAVRGGDVEGVIFHDRGRPLRRGLPTAGRYPVDEPGRLGAGERRGGELQLDP